MVAERSLGSVPLANEEERLDLYIVMMAMEVNYGDRKSRESVLARALESNRRNQSEVYLRFSTVYFDAMDYKSCLELLNRATAMFPQNKV